MISRPTRITDHSATLIDHVYTNKLNNVISSNILTLDLSDHLATVTTILLGSATDNLLRNTKRQVNPDNYEFRLFNDASDQTFKQLITDENWDDVLDGLDEQAQ